MIRKGVRTKLKITILRINHDYPSCNVTKKETIRSRSEVITPVYKREEQ